jgi:hypothetical protein
MTTTGQGTFCADLLGVSSNNPSENPNNLSFSFFSDRKIPKDPLPAVPSSSCNDYLNGYTFYNRYGANNVAKPSNGAQNYEYVIGVGIEGDRSVDEATLTNTGTTSNSRTQYFLQGKPCNVAGTISCSQ